MHLRCSATHYCKKCTLYPDYFSAVHNEPKSAPVTAQQPKKGGHWQFERYIQYSRICAVLHPSCSLSIVSVLLGHFLRLSLSDVKTLLGHGNHAASFWTCDLQLAIFPGRSLTDDHLHRVCHFRVRKLDSHFFISLSCSLIFMHQFWRGFHTARWLPLKILRNRRIIMCRSLLNSLCRWTNYLASGPENW